MSTYFSVVNTSGLAKLATAVTLGATIGVVQMAVGDGNGSPVIPNINKTTLVNERYRGNVNLLQVDPEHSNRFLAQMVIPPDIGGFDVREAMLICNDGAVFANCNLPQSYKPTLAEQGIGEMTIEFVFEVENALTAGINLIIDPYVTLATRQWSLANFMTNAQAVALIDATLKVGYTPTSGGGNLAVGGRYMIFDNGTYFLPSSGPNLTGSVVTVSLAHNCKPTIQRLSSPDLIRMNGATDLQLELDIEADFSFKLNKPVNIWETR